MSLTAPFPWYGGKSLAADLVWSRFGNVENYIEPFFGSGAVMLGRPEPRGFEVVNDLDCFIANFWRCIRDCPKRLARHAAHPVNEADLHARHLWLSENRRFRERMHTDPDFLDHKVAGWWVWGASVWIGHGWGSLGHQRKRPAANGRRGAAGRDEKELSEWFSRLAARFAAVTVLCGDWERALGRGIGTGGGVTGILLDPPYGSARDRRCYQQDEDGLAERVRDRAIELGADRKIRVALCGHEGEHRMPQGWKCVKWVPNGQAGENAALERIWFSPHCPEPHPELF